MGWDVMAVVWQAVQGSTAGETRSQSRRAFQRSVSVPDLAPRLGRSPRRRHDRCPHLAGQVALYCHYPLVFVKFLHELGKNLFCHSGCASCLNGFQGEEQIVKRQNAHIKGYRCNKRYTRVTYHMHAFDSDLAVRSGTTHA